MAENFSGYLTNVGYAPLTQDVVNLHRKLVADGRPASAQLVRVAFQKFTSNLQSIARDVAVEAEKAVKDHELMSRVRGSSGMGPSLGDFIGRSAPITDVPGTVGVNDEDYLDANGVGWWWTNEEGYWGHIGREIRGFFTPSYTRPIAGGGGDTGFLPRQKGGKGEILEPIPDRYFVREGFNDAKALWHARVRQAEAVFVSEVQAAVRSGSAGARP